MSRALTFTQVKVRRAVKAVESAGLRAGRVTFLPDGSFAIDIGDAEDNRETARATSWDDV